MPFNKRDASATLTSTAARGSAAVSPHFLASEAAMEIMRSGGSAVDGAIAANAVLGVVLPTTCGPGGDLFALVHGPGFERPACLNSSGRAGSGVSAEGVRQAGHDAIPLQGLDSITVPGAVDGWMALHDDYGRVDLAQILAPAIDLAEGGFPVSDEFSRSLGRIHERIKNQGSATPLYSNGIPAPGSTVRRVRHAEVLRAIAAHGRTGFYEGEVGAAIVTTTEQRITADDLTVNQAEWVAPAGLDIFGVTGWTIPPNSQGYLTLATLKIFESLGAPRDPDDPSFHHALIEAYRSVASERDTYLSDPETARDVAFLLDPARLESRASRISMERASPWPVPREVPGGTAYLATRDASGLGVSLMQSNFWGIGSGFSAGDTGIFLHNRGAGFNLIPGHRNELTPGRRPLHTLAPTIWTRNASTAFVLGTRGGQFQPQIVAQLAASLLHGNVAPADAQASPRWQVESWQSGESSVVNLEPGLFDTIGGDLATRGHTVRQYTRSTEGWGPVALIDERAGVVVAAADPRVSTATALTG
jgi:gamma-glutamyltranspeptidase / glutathione hydrolase